MKIFLYFSCSLMASMQLEIGNDMVVETTGNVYVAIDGELDEIGTGYFKGKISSGARAGMTLSTDAIDYNTVWLPQNGTPWNYSKFGDFNLDGGIDAIEYNLHWLPNNGTASQVPF